MAFRGIIRQSTSTFAPIFSIVFHATIRQRHKCVLLKRFAIRHISSHLRFVHLRRQRTMSAITLFRRLSNNSRVVANMTMSSFQSAQHARRNNRLLLNRQCQFQFIIGKGSVLNLNSILTLFGLRQVNIVRQKGQTQMEQVLNRFLTPRLRLPLVRVLRLNVKGNRRLRTFNSFARIRCVRAITMAMFRATSRQTPNGLFHRFIIPILFYNFSNRTTMDLSKVGTVSNVNDTNSDSVRLLKLIPHDKFLRLRGRLISKVLVTQAYQQTIQVKDSKRSARAMDPRLIRTRRLHANRHPILLLNARLYLLVEFLGTRRRFLSERTFRTIILFFFLRGHFIL